MSSLRTSLLLVLALTVSFCAAGSTTDDKQTSDKSWKDRIIGPVTSAVKPILNWRPHVPSFVSNFFGRGSKSASAPPPSSSTNGKSYAVPNPANRSRWEQQPVATAVNPAPANRMAPASVGVPSNPSPSLNMAPIASIPSPSVPHVPVAPKPVIPDSYRPTIPNGVSEPWNQGRPMDNKSESNSHVLHERVASPITPIAPVPSAVAVPKTAAFEEQQHHHLNAYAQLFRDVHLQRVCTASPSCTSRNLTAVAALQNVRVLALLFSVERCGYCRAFMHPLKRFHQEAKRQNLGFEVIYVEAEEHTDERQYYMSIRHSDWLHIPYDGLEGETIRLWDHYDVKFYPTFLLIRQDKAGSVISKFSNPKGARRQIENLLNSAGDDLPLTPQQSRSVAEIVEEWKRAAGAEE